MSAEIAYCFVTAGLADFGAEAGITDPGLLDQDFVHLHVPERAAPKDRPPKDRPSAGVTMATALLSLARGQAIGGIWA